ncbi:MAG: cation:proton antiporter [Clostridia bacterium]|nr:cation:proton antiporter [Clostridia bacterium]
MLNNIFGLTNGSATSIILSVALMLVLGYLTTRITKLIGLPNVSAYIIVGILLGPFFLNIIPKSIIAGTDFLADISLALISFCIGEYFRFSAFKKNGIKSLVIAAIESLSASAVIFILVYFILRLNLALSLVLSTLASVTAPTSTMMTIRQTKATGDFVDTLLQVIATDNIIGLFSFSIAVSIAASISKSAETAGLVESIIIPIIKNILMIMLGAGMAFLMMLLMPPGKKSADNRLIVSLSILFLFCGVCVVLNVSPLLGCMAMGTVYRNASKDENLFKQLNYFSPPLLLLFFVRSGMNFNLNALLSNGGSNLGISLFVISILYFLIRIMGKYCGSFLGCIIMKKHTKTTNYLGLALIPQAGAAIPLAALCHRSLGGELGDTIQTIIVSAGIMYEIVGPILAKLALFKSGAYSNRLDEITAVSIVDENGKPRSQVDILIEQLQQIHDEIKKDREKINENEKAFTEAAEEQQLEESFELFNRGRFLNRR